jgi:hypothetical protein
MNKTFEVMEAYTGNYEIKAYEDGDCVLDIIVNDYSVEGARRVLEAQGYAMTSTVW